MAIHRAATSYLTRLYGNPSAQVTTEQVSKLRTNTISSGLVWLTRAIAAAVMLIFFVGLAYVWRSRRVARSLG